MEQFERTKLLIGQDGVDNLTNKKVIIFGVGGVGGYVADMLVRTGIGSICIVDFDVVNESNINRQVIALHSTIGMAKVDVLKQRLLDINPNCKIECLNKKLLPENVEIFNLNQYDYVIDCIDMVTSKIALIDFCYKNKINIISALGAGNRLGIPNFVVKDIYQTSYDGLAKVLRKKLKERHISKHKVVVCEQKTIKSDVVGSIAFYPTACACTVCAQVVMDLLKKL